MTAAVSRWATDADHPLIEDYARFCHELGVTDRALRDRLHLARSFLAQHRDLETWLTRTTPTRLADLLQIKAWSLVSWAALTGRVRIDLDLLAAKDLGGMSATVRQLWPVEFDRLWEAARRLGWSYNWSRGVIDQFVPAVVAWSSMPIDQIGGDHLDSLEAALGDVNSASVTTRRQWHGRLFGLRQLLFECGQIAAPPRRGPTAAPIADRLATISAVEIRRVMIAYVNVRSAVLSRSSIHGLVDALVPFGEFLTVHHPEVGSFRQLERADVEEYLVWNRTRRWRGRLARDKQVSASVVHAGVLALRNLLDDITLWGWAERPDRRLVFATDVPRLPRPLPRGLAPDIDAALLHEVARLDDGFARVAITLLRRAGCASANCWTSSSAVLSTTARPARGCACRSASSAPNAPFPSTPTPWASSTCGSLDAVNNGPMSTPERARPATTCSRMAAGDSRGGAFARASTPPSAPPGSPGRAASRCA